MTGIRKSFAFCRERDGFGTGIATTDKVVCYPLPHINATGEYTGSNAHMGKCSTHDHWLAPPPGSFFSHTSSRGVQRIQTTGSKFWDAHAYGQMSGTWEWTFPLSYDYVEPLLFAFEDVNYYNVVNYGISGNTNVYSFRKANNRRVRSFTVKVAEDDMMIGSSGCEEVILKGCVVSGISFSKSNSESPIRVTMKGFYATESVRYSSSLPKTVYREMQKQGAEGLVEWAGLYKTGGSGSLAASNYMANAESLSISMENSAAAVYSVASPFASNYHEGLANVQMTAKIWYTDPLQYRAMLMSDMGDGTYAPMSKGLRPYGGFAIVATNLHDDPVPGLYSDEDFSQSQTEVYNPRVWKINGVNTRSPSYETHGYLQNNYLVRATAYVMFRLNSVALKSYVADKGDGSELSDTIGSSDCKTLYMDIVQGSLQRASGSGSVKLKAYAPIYAWTKYTSSTSTVVYDDRTETTTTWTEGSSYVPAGVSAYGFIMAPDTLWITTAASNKFLSGVDAWFSHIVVDVTLKYYTFTKTITYNDGRPPSSSSGEAIYESTKGILLNPHALDKVDSSYGEPVLTVWASAADFRSGAAAYNTAHPDDPIDPNNLASGVFFDPSPSRGLQSAPQDDDGDDEDIFINIEQEM